MEVKVGVQHSPRELVLESSQSPEEVIALVEKAVAGGVLSLTDEKGRQVIVPGEKISYVDIGVAEVRRVGFGAA